jgi:hypothetical protein
LLHNILLSSLRGYNKENGIITLTLEDAREEIEMEGEAIDIEETPIMLQFTNIDILDAAFEATEKFGR